MSAATVAQALLSLLILLVFFGFLVWGFRTGQFKDVEGPKVRMLEDGDEGKEDEDE